MFRLRSAACSALMLSSLAVVPAPASAGVGDLLVAPTRLILTSGRGAEVILNNIGEATATYRVSAELRRMRSDGTLEEVAAANATEQAAQSMVIFSPRRVTLPPNQPQTIRIAARAPQGLADGEYRVHMLFRAIPDAKPVTDAAKPKGVSFSLIPIYGVTIPVIVRLGNLEAKAGIADVHLTTRDGHQAIALDLTRTGSRSTYGEIRVTRAGVSDPIALMRGVAVYPEVNQRSVIVPINSTYKGAVSGPVTIQYVETSDSGNTTLAETSAVLR